MTTQGTAQKWSVQTVLKGKYKSPNVITMQRGDQTLRLLQFSRLHFMTDGDVDSIPTDDIWDAIQVASQYID